MSTQKAPARPITSEEFDRRFDAGEDMSEFVDWSRAERPNIVARRVNVDFPAWMVSSLDKEAKRIGVTRQALIKLWLAEKLEERMHP